MGTLRNCIVLIKKDDKILLGLNHRGFNEGKWTGFGGLLKTKEDITKFALRRTKDQCGLIIEKLEKVGRIDVEIGGLRSVVQVHVFMVEAFSGDPQDSRDMQVKWFTVEDIPFQKMKPDYSYWLPSIINGENVKGYFVYQNETLIHQDVVTEPRLEC